MKKTSLKKGAFANVDIQNFETIKPLLEELLNRPIVSKTSLEEWLQNVEELQAVINEEESWISINAKKDTSIEKFQAISTSYYGEVHPKIAPFYNQFDQKLINSKFIDELDELQYFIYLRYINGGIRVYRDENVALFAKTKLLVNKYFKLKSKQFIEIKGEAITIRKAYSFLENADRNFRKEIFEKIQRRNNEDKKASDEIYSQLVELRHTAAINADYNNFRDYTFVAYDRHDYTPKDCLQLHQSIKEVVVPIVDKIYSKRKQDLGYEKLKPYDLKVDTGNKPSLLPYNDVPDLINKTIRVFNQVDETFGGFIAKMNEKGYLDLTSRMNKAPGGFLVRFPVSKTPFIFMNATSTLRDVSTLAHECGHAINDYLIADLPLGSIKDLRAIPSELSEYPAMAMELLTMEHWEVFFENEADLRRAKSKHLEHMITFYPWFAIIDHFQHWIYLNPDHTAQQRAEKWVQLFSEYNSSIVDYSGYEITKANKWQSTAHLYFCPFYFIEYAMAQLGAIATWKQYKTAPKRAIQNYKNILRLGYTKTIPEIYKAGEIEFDFSKSYVNELFSFVYDEYLKLQ